MKPAFLLLPLLSACAPAMTQTPTPPARPAAETIYDFEMRDIKGEPVKLEQYRGKVLLVVNVASKCGLTPQYKGLQALYDEYKDQGLVVLGFPANDFMGQEPGTNEEIQQFCSVNYGVTFPMFEKITVKGEDKNALYQWLLASSDRPNDEIEWNFAKFLIGRDGKVMKRLSPRDVPESPAVREAVKAALTQK